MPDLKARSLARFTEESKQRVREATDLVELAGEYTELCRAGSDRMVGRCPLHDERTPSFTITPSKQLFKCFGCDAGGDALSLVEHKEGLDFPGALEFLARRAGVELQREDSPKSAEAAQAAEYLGSRGIVLSSWLSGHASRTETGSTGVPAGDPVQATTAHGGNRGLLLECIAGPEIAAGLPSGDALMRLFPDALQRRAAEHIRAHAHDPAAELPDDDELVALITGLLSAPITGAK